MSWLEGLAPISGPRWSAGAFWAEDGNPQADDTDWGDSSTWATAHAYDPDAAVSLGLFVGGYDVTSATRTASWGLGQSEPIPGQLQPSSGLLELKGASSAAAGDRVVILTEWDVLYSGEVASTALQTTIERVTTTLGLVDELARIARTDWPAGVELGGDFDNMAQTLQGLMGLEQPVVGVPEMGFPWPQLQRPPSEPSGKVLDVFSEMIRQSLSAAAWTPAGLRVNTIDLVYLDGTDRGWADVDVTDLTQLAAHTVTRDPARIYNVAQVADLAGPEDPILYPASIEAYGAKPLPDLDVTEWSQQGLAMSTFLEDVLDGLGEASVTVPTPWIDAWATIGARRHKLARLMPFDYLTDGDPKSGSTTERYRILRVAHSIGLDAWSVALQGILVRDNEAY